MYVPRFAWICALSITIPLSLITVGLASGGLGLPVARAQSTGTRSPLIDSLAQRADLTTTRAWQTLRAHGLPNVEPVPGHPKEALITLCWLGDSTTHNVVAITPLALIDFAGSVMHRLGHTNVWYVTFRLPTDTRFTYRFAPNDNLVPFDRDTNLSARLATMRRDTANPLVFTYGEFGDLSILQLPDAPSDSLIVRRPGAPAGTVTRFTITSHVLGRDRIVWIYTPPGYDVHRSADYPVVVFFDGESYQGLIPTPTILDNLIATRAMTPILGVFVDNPASTREVDLNCNPAWGRFLANELVPWLGGRYHVTGDGRHRVVAGYSLGGLAAACAAVEYSDVFGVAIAQSGSFFRSLSREEPEWLSRHIARSNRLPIRFVMSIGRYETAAIPSRDPSMLTASRHLRDVLLAKGYQLNYRELSSGHEQVAWRAVLGDALRDALPDR